MQSFIKHIILKGNDETLSSPQTSDISTNPISKKKFDVVQRISVEIVAEPLVVDAHGTWYSEETVQAGKDSFDLALKEGRAKPNLFHHMDDDGTNLEIVKHYIMPCDCSIGNTPVKAGTWVMEMKWHNEELWKKRTVPVKREDGSEYLEIAGLSLFGMGVINDPKIKDE